MMVDAISRKEPIRGQARTALALVFAAFLENVSTTATQAAPLQVYTYLVQHPTYGNIGMYTSEIDRRHGTFRISSELRIAIKIAGIIVYREEANRTEVWRGDRLITLQSVTTVNGQQLTVKGRSEKDGFLISSPSGTEEAPGSVQPTDAWALNQPGSGVLVSTRTGKVEAVSVVGGEEVTIDVAGRPTTTRHFRVDAETQVDRFDVWLDETHIPVKFRSRELSGQSIDFVLASVDGSSQTITERSNSDR